MEIDRQRSVDPGDERLREASYKAHLRSGGSPLEFAALARESIHKAEKRVRAAEELAAHDIMHMLCRTAEDVLVKWPDKISTIVVADPSEIKNIGQNEARIRIGKGTIAGKDKIVPGIVLSWREDFLFCCQEGIYVNYRDFWHEREVPVRLLLLNHLDHYNYLHKEGLAQHTEKILGDLPLERDLFGGGTHLTGIPISMEIDSEGVERITVYWGTHINYHVSKGNGLDPYKITPERPTYADLYDKALDAFHFEAKRRERGDDPKTLLTYLRERK